MSKTVSAALAAALVSFASPAFAACDYQQPSQQEWMDISLGKKPYSSATSNCVDNDTSSSSWAPSRPNYDYTPPKNNIDTSSPVKPRQSMFGQQPAATLQTDD
jgi:hypothetical protein